MTTENFGNKIRLRNLFKLTIKFLITFAIFLISRIIYHENV